MKRIVMGTPGLTVRGAVGSLPACERQDLRKRRDAVRERAQEEFIGGRVAENCTVTYQLPSKSGGNWMRCTVLVVVVLNHRYRKT